MADVALVSVVHDPDCRLLRAMGDALPALLSFHRGAYVVLSTQTNRTVEDALRRLGVDTEREPRPGVGASRRQALAMARRAGHKYCHYSDLDRALHWARAYPAELAATLERIPSSDLLIIGRTARAFASHPWSMTETESLANHVFALAYGRLWDLCAAARGLSATMVDVILRESRVLGVGSEGEWPALALSRPGLVVDYVEVEGMEYETADRYPEEVMAAGGLEAWLRAESRLPANWLRRLAFAYAIARAALHPGEAGEIHIY